MAAVAVEQYKQYQQIQSTNHSDLHQMHPCCQGSRLLIFFGRGDIIDLGFDDVFGYRNRETELVAGIVAVEIQGVHRLVHRQRLCKT